MAYETEKNRLADIITSTVHIERRRDADLGREATERAFEARQQTGLDIGSLDGEDLIIHPDAETRRARLGVPISVGTAELATWNYLFHDPVATAANGLLNSAPHRAVLDNSFYDNWGFGIYTEMPIDPNTGLAYTNELLRRWYFIIWLSSEPIGTASMTQPSETFSKPISVSGSGLYGYKFDYQGKIVASKMGNWSRSSSATAIGRASIPGRPGKWLLVGNGYYAGYWLQEDRFVALPHPKLV